MCNIIEEEITPELFRLTRCDGVVVYRHPKGIRRHLPLGFVCIDNDSLLPFKDVSLGVPFNE